MKRFREVIGGRFVSRAAAEASPGTTVGESIRRVDVLETCLRQVAADMDQAAQLLRELNSDRGNQMAEMLEQSANAAREVASDDGNEQ